MGLVPSLLHSQKSVTPELLQKYESFKKTPKPDVVRSSAHLTLSPSPQFPLSGSKRSDAVPFKVRTFSEGRQKDVSFSILNIHTRKQAQRVNPPVLPPVVSSTRLPTISYRWFREEHAQRNNSTSPSKRRYADHSIGGADYNPEDAALKMYRKRVIRLSARSKVVIHSYFPPYDTQRKDSHSPLRIRRNEKEKPLEGAKHPQTNLSPKTKLQPYEDDEPLAVTYGDKLVKVQRALNAAFSSQDANE